LIEIPFSCQAVDQKFELCEGLSRFATSHNKQLKAMAAMCLKAPSTSLITSLPGGMSATSSPAGSIGDTAHVNSASTSMKVNPIQHSRVHSDSTIPGRANLSSSPVLSPGLSLASDILLHPPEKSDLSGNGTAMNGTGKQRRQLRDESGCYFRCVSAIYALAKDPSPQVASLGQQVLRFIGLEPTTRISVIGCQTPGQIVNHQRKASLGAVPSPVLSGIPRSFSWIDSSSGSNL
jgi:regulator-associated protein of mTOR